MGTRSSGIVVSFVVWPPEAITNSLRVVSMESFCVACCEMKWSYVRRYLEPWQ
jgi:hypothetical protein